MSVTGPSIVLPGLPSFNAGDPNFKITGFDGWWGTAKPRSELLPNGAAEGAVAIGPWDFAEAYYTLTGLIRSTSRSTLMTYRRALLAAFPATTESTINVLGNGEDVDLSVAVRRYDAPTIDVSANNLTFTFPLVAVDPFKYGTALADSMTVFTGSSWYRTFTIDLVPNPDQFYWAHTIDLVPNPDQFYAAFATDVAAGADLAANLTSGGDTPSRRLTFTIGGPLLAGDWFILSDTTGKRLWANVAVAAGQTLTFDCYRQTASLNGASVDTLVFGEYLTLEPGANTYRLVAGTASAASATATASPAYQ